MVSFRPLCSHKYDWLFCGGIYMGILNYFDILLWFVPASMSAWPGSFSSPPQVDWWSWVLTCPRERRSRWSAASQVKRFFFCGSWTRDLSGWGWCMPHLTLRKVRDPSQVAVLLPGNEPSRFVFASHPRIGWREHLQETLIWACLKMGYNSYFNGEYEHQPLDFDYFQSHGYFFSNQSINYRTRQWIGRRLQGRSWPSVKKSSLFNEQLPTPCDGWFQTTFSKSLGL